MYQYFESLDKNKSSLATFIFFLLKIILNKTYKYMKIDKLRRKEVFNYGIF